MHKFDIICISESHVNSETLSSNVCIYYKKYLPVKILNIKFLHERICPDLKIGNNCCTIVSIYRSSSQSANEFENFSNYLTLLWNQSPKRIRC